MLRARIITAVCALAAIFLVLFVLPPVVVSPVILLVITGAAWEWSRLAGLGAARRRGGHVGRQRQPLGRRGVGHDAEQNESGGELG